MASDENPLRTPLSLPDDYRTMAVDAAAPSLRFEVRIGNDRRLGWASADEPSASACSAEGGIPMNMPKSHGRVGGDAGTFHVAFARTPVSTWGLAQSPRKKPAFGEAKPSLQVTFQS